MAKQDELDVFANGIEQGFMQPGGWKECRYLLGKLVEERDATIRQFQAIVDKLPKTADGVHIGPDMVVYQRQTKDAGKTWDVVPRRVTSSYWPFPGWISCRCYSTREAAQAANP